jgi:hypothetical protein
VEKHRAAVKEHGAAWEAGAGMCPAGGRASGRCADRHGDASAAASERAG